MDTKFWLNDYTILFKKTKLLELWPYKNMSYEEQLNAITRFIILVSLVGYILMGNYIILLFGVILIICIAMIYKFHKKAKIETMKNHFAPPCGDFKNKSNPLDNVLMTDYVDNVNKPEVSKNYGPNEEQLINQKVKQFILSNNRDNKDIHKTFDDLGNELDFEKSMRQFYINPSTTIPNSQDDFLKYCYKSLYSEKPLIVY